MTGGKSVTDVRIMWRLEDVSAVKQSSSPLHLCSPKFSPFLRPCSFLCSFVSISLTDDGGHLLHCLHGEHADLVNCIPFP